MFLSEPADDCEVAFEWIPVLFPDDWSLLQNTWPERSAEWRAGLACILAHFPGPLSKEILRLALADKDDLVAAEAAIALCGHMLRHPELVPFDRSLVPRLQELKQGERGQNLFEVDEILGLNGAGG